MPSEKSMSITALITLSTNKREKQNKTEQNTETQALSMPLSETINYPTLESMLRERGGANQA